MGDELVWRVGILELFKIGGVHHNGLHLYVGIEDVDVKAGAQVLFFEQLLQLHRLDRVLVLCLVAFRLLRYVLVVHFLSILLRLRVTEDVSVVVTCVEFHFFAALRSSLATYLLEVVIVVDSGRSNGVIARKILAKTPLLLVKLTLTLNFVHVEVHGASTYIRRGLGPLHIALSGNSCVLHVGQLGPSASSVWESGEVSLVLRHEVWLLLHLAWCRGEAWTVAEVPELRWILLSSAIVYTPQVSGHLQRLMNYGAVAVESRLGLVSGHWAPLQNSIGDEKLSLKSHSVLYLVQQLGRHFGPWKE